jgi:hypothetical protein
MTASRSAALRGWSTPDCRSARRAQQPAYPTKIIRLIAARLQSANSTASYRNRGQLSSSTHTYNSPDSISRNAGDFEIIRKGIKTEIEERKLAQNPFSK